MEQTIGQKLTCRICKEEPFLGELTEAGVCGNCDFWMEKWQLRNKPQVVRAGGQHYIIGPRHEKIGHGGRLFVIKKDGHIIYANNLWHQGEIPERFQHALPDNAEIL